MRYVPATEVAKLVRAHLRKIDPHTRFSVRTDKWSGGASVNVTVPSGFPEDVRRSLSTELMSWGGQGFDGMTDSTYGKSHTLCATHGVTLVHVGEHFGSLERTHAPCCDSAEPVYLMANSVHVRRDWRDS